MFFLADNRSVGEKEAENNLRICFETALSEAKSASGVDHLTVQAAGLTLAGVDRPKDFALVKKWMSEMPFYSPELKLTIHNDAIGRHKPDDSQMAISHLLLWSQFLGF